MINTPPMNWFVGSLILSLFCGVVWAGEPDQGEDCGKLLPVVSHSDWTELKSRYLELLSRARTTHTDSGASIAQKILLTQMKAKLVEAGFSLESLDREVLSSAAEEDFAVHLQSLNLWRGTDQFGGILAAVKAKDSFQLGVEVLKAFNGAEGFLEPIRIFKTKLPWLLPEDELVLDLVENFLETLVIQDPPGGGLVGADAFRDGQNAISKKMESSPAKWRKRFFREVVMKLIKREIEISRSQMLDNPAVGGEFIEMDDLQAWLQLNYGHEHYARPKDLAQFDGSWLYDAFFLKRKVLNIRSLTLLHYAPQILPHLTIEDLRAIAAEEETSSFPESMAVSLYNANGNSPHHPLIEKYFDEADPRFKTKIQFYRLIEAPTFQKWLDLIVLQQTGDGPFDQMSRSRLEQHSKEFVTKLLAKSSALQIYEEEILPRMKSLELSAPQFQALLFVFMHHKQFGLPMDRRVADLFWPQYNRLASVGLQFLDNHKHPSHVGHDLDTEFGTRR